MMRGVAGKTEVSHTHEEVVRIRRVAADSEELHEIVELAVNIAAYLHSPLADRLLAASIPGGAYRDGRANCDDVALLDEELARLMADLADLRLGDGTT
jgi:hypothetical protein